MHSSHLLESDFALTAGKKDDERKQQRNERS